MYYYDEKSHGWVIKSKNKLDYLLSLWSLYLFEFLPFFIEGLFVHGAKEFFITKQIVGDKKDGKQRS